MSGCAPDLALERHHLGEIAGTASAAWSPHIEGCDRCRARIAAIAADDVALPPLPARKRPRWIAPVLAMAAAAVVVIAVRRPVAVDTFTAKGAGVMALAIEASDGRILAWEGEPLAPGAHAQLYWTSEARGHLAVIGVETSGEVTVLHPEGGGRAAEIGPSNRASLGGRWRVEPSHQGARICAFFSPRPFDIDARSTAACRAGEADAVLQLEVAR